MSEQTYPQQLETEQLSAMTEHDAASYRGRAAVVAALLATASLLAGCGGESQADAPTLGPSKITRLIGSYPVAQRAMELPADHCQLTDGQSSANTTKKQAINLSLANIRRAGAAMTKADFDQFSVSDISNQVMAAYPDNFAPEVMVPQPSGEPAKIQIEFTDPVNQVEYFVWHFTTFPNSEDNLDGSQFAAKMHELGDITGAEYYANGDGSVWRLSHDAVNEIASMPMEKGGPTEYFNWRSQGIEMAGCAQPGIGEETLKAGFYTTAGWLIDNGFITPDTPSVKQVVDTHIRGHHELNPMGHTDWASISADAGRKVLVNFLVNQLGYNR